MTKENKVDAIFEAKKESVAKQIQTVLEENNMALYPYLDRQSNATVARVTLVETEKKEEEVVTENA